MVTDVKAVNSFDAAKHAVATDANVTTSDLMVDCDYIDGSTVPNQPAGEFWAILSHLLVIFQVIILLCKQNIFLLDYERCILKRYINSF